MRHIVVKKEKGQSMERQEKIALARLECLQKLQVSRVYHKAVQDNNDAKEWENMEENSIIGGKTLLLRCVFSLLLFCGFLGMRFGNYRFCGIDYNEIHNKIRENKLAVMIERQVEIIQLEK